MLFCYSSSSCIFANTGQWHSEEELRGGSRKQLRAGIAKGKTSPSVTNPGSFLVEELVEQHC